MISDETKKIWDERLSFLLDDAPLNTRISEWEEEFIDSLSIWRSQGKDLTWKQSKKLKEIWYKIDEELL